MSDAASKPKKVPVKRVGVRVKPASNVDVVHVGGVCVRRGEVVRLQEKDAEAAVAASRVLEFAPED